MQCTDLIRSFDGCIDGCQTTDHALSSAETHDFSRGRSVGRTADHRALAEDGFTIGLFKHHGSVCHGTGLQLHTSRCRGRRRPAPNHEPMTADARHAPLRSIFELSVRTRGKYNRKLTHRRSIRNEWRVTVTCIPDGAEVWNSNVLSEQGTTYDHTSDSTGTYDYFCIPHKSLGMVGCIVVGESGGPAEGSMPPDEKVPKSRTIIDQAAVLYSEFSRQLRATPEISTLEATLAPAVPVSILDSLGSNGTNWMRLASAGVTK